MFGLAQNYPNPFTGMGATTIKYSIPNNNEHVILRIYDVAGRRVRTLVDEVHVPGAYSVMWDGRNSRGNKVSTGIYFYQLIAGNKSISKKIVLFSK